jgi:hypothetical protein
VVALTPSAAAITVAFTAMLEALTMAPVTVTLHARKPTPQTQGRTKSFKGLGAGGTSNDLARQAPYDDSL